MFRRRITAGTSQLSAFMVLLLYIEYQFQDKMSSLFTVNTVIYLIVITIAINVL